ncbi:unnamed protein product [Heligmosomoides polygyrus]|uniref:MG3 domain-containing protein n=1 Tax=Heligmosomoides polygyrus TaxID=6339 RepID=A0A183FX54_HELPZ|nr:unnamed protein product [Heligmosomoides polygyrus]
MEFPIFDGVHQGSALFLLLFVVVIDAISRNLQIAAPWTLLYADNCNHLPLFRLKLNVKKTEYLTTDVSELGSIKINDTELARVTSFKYLGSPVTSDGSLKLEVNVRFPSALEEEVEVTKVTVVTAMEVTVATAMEGTVATAMVVTGMVDFTITLVEEGGYGGGGGGGGLAMLMRGLFGFRQPYNNYYQPYYQQSPYQNYYYQRAASCEGQQYMGMQGMRQYWYCVCSGVVSYQYDACRSTYNYG